MTSQTPPHSNGPLDADVVIVGAGISGMSAANVLHDNGLHVIAVEANTRVGGRTWTESVEGGLIDYGGMFIGDTHTASTELGKSLGLRMERARPAGQMTYTIRGEVLRAPDGGYPEGDFSEELNGSLRLLDTVAASVGRDAPWRGPEAAQLDGMTAAQWMDEHITHPTVRAIHDVDINTMLGADPAETSMLYWAYFVAQCDGIRPLQVGANSYLWTGGASQIAQRIADRLGKGNVLLGEPVTHIEHRTDEVTVVSQDRRLHARHVVVAIPPSGAQLIRFDPQLPPDRCQLQMRAPIGRMSKVQVRYPTRFWVESGLSGEMVDVEIGLTALDGTRASDSMATLIGFIGGRNQDRWFALGPEARRKQFIELLVSAFGSQAAEPALYHETHWPRQPYQMGGPSTYMPTGVLSSCGGALREPVGRIHFAGTETADRWAGYMEGGIRAGQRAAAEITRAI